MMSKSQRQRNKNIISLYFFIDICHKEAVLERKTSLTVYTSYFLKLYIVLIKFGSITRFFFKSDANLVKNGYQRLTETNRYAETTVQRVDKEIIRHFLEDREKRRSFFTKFGQEWSRNM